MSLVFLFNTFNVIKLLNIIFCIVIDCDLVFYLIG